MSNLNELSYQSTAYLNLWLKLQSDDELTLADMPNIIPLRWSYFRDNWNFIKDSILSKASSASDADFLRFSVNEFSSFIEKQRHQKINPFSDSIIFYRFYSIFDNVLIDSINLTNEERDIIKAQTIFVNSFSKNDFLQIKNNIIKYRDALADTNGLQDNTYNETVGRSSAVAQKNVSIVDLTLMAKLQASIASVEFILANLFAVDAAVDPFALARANANNPEINIGQYASGNLVKMEYGESLQNLAYRYLGDPAKWIDIAIANGLKPPYIDEVGERVFLIANGSNNQINIAETDINGHSNISKLYINQVITLQSNTQPFPDQRTIVGIRQIPVSGEILIELDGEADLSLYQLADQASIRLFAPNTTNSSFFILIPSTKPLDNSRNEELPWFLTKSDEDEKRAKIDIAIDDNGEINFGTSGDLKLSYGLANSIQAIKLKMMTELGSLRQHPDFGLINVTGLKNDNIDGIKGALIDSINKQIEVDERFSRVETIDVSYGIPSGNNTAGFISITMSVRLAGGDTVIPISFTVNR